MRPGIFSSGSKLFANIFRCQKSPPVGKDLICNKSALKFYILLSTQFDTDYLLVRALILTMNNSKVIVSDQKKSDPIVHKHG